jgi:C4-dicarboxylate transporter
VGAGENPRKTVQNIDAFVSGMGLQQAQVMAIVMFITIIAAVLYEYRKSKHKPLGRMS